MEDVISVLAIILLFVVLALSDFVGVMTAVVMVWFYLRSRGVVGDEQDKSRDP